MTDFTFAIKRIQFDEDYTPADSTRLTTNFANLARGENRKQNLKNAITMMNNRLNDLADWDNPTADRYAIELDIITAELHLQGKDFATMEVLQPTIIDKKHGKRIKGIVGNNFSSYVRDYDFSVLLLNYNKGRENFEAPAHYGELHGKLFTHLLLSDAYKAEFDKPPVICLSVANGKTYHKTTNVHPILGVEYTHTPSLTDAYFAKMGLTVRYFMPNKCVAPLAFYFQGDLLADYTNLELLATIATMETFQKIYRPEIYNANSVAGTVYTPSLTYDDYSLTNVTYDRKERSELAVKQGKYTEEHFILPYKEILAAWSGVEPKHFIH